ncbi:MAG: VanW family protein [Candidatus Kerfeldbacteria bacterium]|nr:VanW family protein [Candidatus Kerfeldbacteria bacterium]
MAKKQTTKKSNSTKAPSSTAPRFSFRTYRAPLLVLGISIVVGGSVLLGTFAYGAQFDARLLPHTRVGTYDIGDRSYDAARDALVRHTNELLDTGITLVYDAHAVGLEMVYGDAANPELATPLASYHIDESLNDIIADQRSMSYPERAYYALRGKTYRPSLSIDAVAMSKALKALLSAYEAPAHDAVFVIADDSITVAPAEAGTAFSYTDIMSSITSQLLSMQTASIPISLQPDQPDVDAAEATTLISTVGDVLARAPYQLQFDEKKWEITRDQIAAWIRPAAVDGVFTVVLDNDQAVAFLEEVATGVDVAVKESKFQVSNGRVTEFQPAEEGRTVDIAASVVELNAMIQSDAQSAQLVVDIIAPEATEGSALSYGIKELIGEGRSNFKGSPANRRHNIGVGASALNGLMIKPGEEFSLINALGEIDGEHGYKQELVIKGNKTVPEYGGGLCQIGTTTFRSVLDAGLKITERKNHSYRVSYYEPAGTDATIYDPAPDFKFINDTGHHVLLTTEINGDELVFRLYGTDDGRTVSLTNPRIYNLAPPGPTKLIETTDLAPGVKKCTEKAHTGADAEFNRTVTYANGEVMEETFRSHYKPWQEVCLIGVEPTPAEPAATEEAL